MLPKATALFLLKDSPAHTAEQQIENDDERGWGDVWPEDREQYLKGLDILSEMRPGGPETAVEMASECAGLEFLFFGRAMANEYLVKLDQFTLQVVRREASLGHDLQFPRGSLHTSYTDLLETEMASNELHMERLIERMHSDGRRPGPRPLSPSRQQNVKSLVGDDDATSVVKRFWFPSTLEFLRAMEVGTHLETVLDLLKDQKVVVGGTI